MQRMVPKLPQHFDDHCRDCFVILHHQHGHVSRLCAATSADTPAGIGSGHASRQERGSRICTDVPSPCRLSTQAVPPDCLAKP